MSLTVRYQNVADDVVGESVRGDHDLLIDEALRTTSFSATVAFTPPLRMVNEVFVGNYCDEARRNASREPFIVFVHANGRHAAGPANRFQAEAWCDRVAAHDEKIAGWCGGTPSGRLPSDLRNGDVRLDWIVEEAYLEIMFTPSLDDTSSGFETRIRQLDQLLAELWEQIVHASKGKAAVPLQPSGPRLSVFLCYAGKDRNFVRRLDSALRSRAISTWFDENEVLVGEDFMRKMEDGLKTSNHVAVVLSPNFVDGGPWAKEEFRSSLARQLDEGRVIVLPVLYRECAVPELLRSKTYADFRKSFRLGVENLARSVRRLSGT